MPQNNMITSENTELIDCTQGINHAGIELASDMLKEGRLVAMPTETVYGLAANALDEKAVAGIFTAKGRPQDNPLIVHVASIDWLSDYVSEMPEAAVRLMDAFWPGPLTIILKKSPAIPDIVSAGLDTAAFRCPSHPVAHALLDACGLPLAAPSANLSGSPSPTRASHVQKDLDGRIAAIIDGGDCGVGVESTVITLADGVPRVLRPGGVTAEQLCAVIGAAEIDPAVTHRLMEGVRVASPGMKYKHYAPKARVVIVKGSIDKVSAYVNENSREGVMALCFDGEESSFNVPCITYGDKDSDEQQAHRLFDALRSLDETDARTVYARCPRTQGVGLAVYNRLLRAAGFEVIEL